MANSFLTQGTQLQVTINNNVTNIDGAIDIAFGPIKKTTIDDTSISDTAIKWKMGLPDYGSLTFNLKWDPADAAHVYLKTSTDNASSPIETWTCKMKNLNNNNVVATGAIESWGSIDLKKSALGMLAVSAHLNTLNIT